MLVLIADRIEEEGLHILMDDPAVSVVRGWEEPDEFASGKGQAVALIVRSATKVTDDLMAAMPNLRVVGRAGIGVDNIDLQAATRRGVAVVHVPGANTVSAAEHALALMLSLTRQIHSADASMRRGEWARSRFRGQILRDRTLALIGVGRIARVFGKLSHQLGMRVVGFDPYATPESIDPAVIELVDLEGALRAGDVVSLHVPLTSDTHHLIDEHAIGLMKPSAFLINTARGGVIDEGALAKALREGRLAGAALDVFEIEPLPDDSPLRTAERVLLTPHLGAATSEAQAFVSTGICSAVREFLRTGTSKALVYGQDLRRARSVFVSHSTEDRDFVQRELVRFLQDSGVSPWYAPTEIRTSAQWERSILRGMSACEWFLLVMSPRSAQSEWVKDEVHWAVANRSGRILPILIEDCSGEDFHIRVPRLQFIDFRHDPDEARALLVQTIRSEIGYEDT